MLKRYLLALLPVLAAGAAIHPTACDAQAPSPSAPPITVTATVATPAPSAPVASPASTASASPASKPSAGKAETPKPAASGKPTPAPSPSAAPPISVVVNIPPPPRVEDPPNNWGPGLVGIAILCVGGFFAFRAIKNRGMTVQDALNQLGIETPANSPMTSVAPLKPAPTPLPPLPSLSDLPAAGPAASAATAVATAKPRTSGLLVGISGPVDGQKFDLSRETQPFTIGRDVASSLSLPNDTAISRKHAAIAKAGSDWSINDAGSSNGTFVNGAKVNGSQTLRAGDEIQIGAARFRFEG